MKKFLPGERRSWKVFGMDTVKQMSSMLFAHLLNVVLAIKLHEISGEGNGCVWYLMNYLCDFFIGMTLSLILLRFANVLAVRHNYAVSKMSTAIQDALCLITNCFSI